MGVVVPEPQPVHLQTIPQITRVRANCFAAGRFGKRCNGPRLGFMTG